MNIFFPNFSAVFNCIKLVSSSISDEPDSTPLHADEKQLSNCSSPKQGYITLVPISKEYGTQKTNTPFPYFEQTLISWIRKQKSVRALTMIVYILS